MNLPTDTDADPIITALRKIETLHPRSFAGFDMGAEIERANRLRERADGSFYTRGPCEGDQDLAETLADQAYDSRE